jgi:hypothetical protein
MVDLFKRRKKLARLRFLKFKLANVDLKVAQSPGEPSSHRETSGVRCDEAHNNQY